MQKDTISFKLSDDDRYIIRRYQEARGLATKTIAFRQMIRTIAILERYIKCTPEERKNGKWRIPLKEVALRTMFDDATDEEADLFLRGFLQQNAHKIGVEEENKYDTNVDTSSNDTKTDGSSLDDIFGGDDKP